MTSSARLENFDLLKVVGRGCMGKVFLARDKMTDELVAIKSISKEKVLRQNEVEHILGERDILANIADNNHPYLMKLRYSFQTEGHLFLVLDYLPGGDIATQLARYYRFSEERSRFYAAEILLGLEELHRMGIVYRDLKPENMLIDRHGHILLTDFGLSKQLPTEGYDNLGCPRYRRRTKTFCGTAEYLAPEMLRGEIYDQGIDFWSLGTCLYEMMTGMTPFWAENHSKMYQRVLFDRLHFPANMSWEARSLITGLLAKDPQKRLGAGEFGVEQVKSHPFFASVNWSSFMERRVTAPVVPPVAHAEDVSNFEDAFINLPVELAATNRDYL
ncbi:putative RAC-beta serine/threonine-protein kinase-A, partial [Dimargaris cristalligena]